MAEEVAVLGSWEWWWSPDIALEGAVHERSSLDDRTSRWSLGRQDRKRGGWFLGKPVGFSSLCGASTYSEALTRRRSLSRIFPPAAETLIV